ncbi:MULTISPECIES: hypothetical protein [unclassified Variovorax]|uniref:hypothetical protein n=1 Tax=unclassified Variovorax TaxID=663243 RepID=UPI0013196178|nr:MULTISPECIES: hypothetical protein [unclassified Variovorax]VTU42553.1 hypothetical protein H6P1_00219 [Variovorax sp. PBL-H6]VTU43850.1 hypothetical protein SRS16P1_00683 [Variovorax sp. SRS16]VTU43914.1 hypothetical protein E5P1_00676 [Variovorax sp. PBL-E5]
MTTVTMHLQKKLKSMRIQSGDARRVFDALRSYENKMETVTVERLVKLTKLGPRRIRTVLNALEGLQMGKLVLGRRGMSTRFVWDEGFRKFATILPAAQPNEPKDVDPVAALIMKSVGNATSTVVHEWAIQLDTRRKARIQFPETVTRADLVKIQSFCEKYSAQLPA